MNILRKRKLFYRPSCRSRDMVGVWEYKKYSEVKKMGKMSILLVFLICTLFLFAACSDDPAAPAAHILRFDPHGGAGTMAPLSLTEGERRPLPPNSFTSNGYAFAGWATVAGGEVVYGEGASYTMGTADATLYAVWHISVTNRTLTFNSGGGTGIMAPLVIREGSQTNLPGCVFAKEGRVFAGWATSEGGTPVYANQAPYIMGITDTTLFAVWRDPLLIFDASGGVGTMEPLAQREGVQTNLPACSFTSNGCFFAGWAMVRGGAVVYTNQQSFTMGIVDQTLYAVWQRWMVNYTLAFDAGGGDGFMPFINIPAGTATNLPASTYTRSGYVFAGWATNHGGEVAYTDCASYPMGTAHAVLYAVWTYVRGSSWEEKGNAPFAGRSGHAALIFDNRIWVVGGFDGSFMNDIWIFDGSAWRCATNSAAFPARHGHKVVFFNGDVLLVGGIGGMGRYNDVWRLKDNGKSQCTTNAAGFSARFGHACVVFKNKLWIIGGNDGTYKNDIWSSEDGISFELKTPAAGFSPRYLHACVVDANRIWLIGGTTAAGSKNDVWFSEDGVQWSKATDSALFAPRSGHACVVYDDKLWVLGGYVGGSGLQNDVWYSADGEVWERAMNTVPFPVRSGHAGIVFNDRIWVIGGENEEGVMQDVWCAE